MNDLVLFADTETTGRLDFKLPDNATSQPHVVQYAGIIVDEDGFGRVVGAYQALVKPAGWDVPEEVTAIHGWSHDDCMRYGANRIGVFTAIDAMVKRVSMSVFYNSEFDTRVININGNRSGVGTIFGKNNVVRCAMKTATDICKLPKPAGSKFPGFKYPKLSEAYKHFFGKEPEQTHNAMADLLSTRDVYRKLVELGAFK